MSLYTIKEEIFPTKEQENILWQTFGACRFIFNHMLQRNIKRYKRRKEKILSYNEMQNLLPKMKELHAWLKDIDSQALQHSCRRLSLSFKSFFKNKPNFPSLKAESLHSKVILLMD